jgi:hypothetical protein
MKIHKIILFLPILASCFSNSEAEYKSAAEKMCACVHQADSISNLDPLKKMDYSELDYSRCASELEVDPFRNEFKSALKSSCPDLNIRHESYLKEATRTFNQ